MRERLIPLLIGLLIGVPALLVADDRTYGWPIWVGMALACGLSALLARPEGRGIAALFAVAGYVIAYVAVMVGLALTVGIV